MMIWWVLVRRGKWLKPWSTHNNHAHKVSQKSVWPIKDSRGAVKSEKEGRGRGRGSVLSPFPVWSTRDIAQLKVGGASPMLLCQ